MRASGFTRGLYGWGLVLILILIWQIIPETNVISPTVLPPATEAFASLYSLLVNGTIVQSLLATLARVLGGYFLGALIGVSIGLLMGLSRTAYRTGDPLVQLLRPMPAAVLLPLAILYLGLGNAMIVSLIAYGCIWPVLINTMDGVRAIDPLILDTAREFNITGSARLVKIILPASAPYIFSGLRISFAIGWIVGITAEILSTATTEGLGALVFQYLNSGGYSSIYSVIIVVAISSYVLNRALLYAQKKIIPWHAKSKGRY